MTTVVVGGHSRNIGKTSVAAGLIAAFPDAGWTALKITQYGHGVCSINGHACGCAVAEHAYAITEERESSGRSDTARFLASGARRSFWVRTKQGQLELALPALLPLIAAERHVIIESNSILAFLNPDLYLVVLSHAVTDFKESARRFLTRADAAIVVADPALEVVWGETARAALANVPIFRAEPPDYVPEGLRTLVADRITRR